MSKNSEGGSEPEESPYKLSPEALRPPKTGVGQWFEDLVALQREGIDQGVVPQNIRSVSKSMREEWRGRVWSYHVSKLSPEERAQIRRTTVPGREKHTHKGPFTGDELPRDEGSGSGIVID